MYRIAVWGFALLTALSSWTVVAAVPPAGSPVARHGALSVRHGQLLDAHGRPVQLRGMSLFWSQWQPQYYNAHVIDWLARDWKIDVVRAAIAVKGPHGYLQQPQRQLHEAETVIDAAIARGLYVIVDWHAHHPHAAAAVRFFRTIARRYGNTPNVIYETFNEPLPDQPWKTVIRPYHMRVIAAIRAIDPDNLVVAGTRSWSQDVDEAAADPLPFHNIAYTLHFYAGTHKQSLRDKADRAMALGAALFVTEYGTANADGNGPIDDAETQRWWQWLDRHHISYVNWSVGDKRESTAALRPGASPDGHWPQSMLTPSGRMVRAHLRAAWRQARRGPAASSSTAGGGTGG